MNILIRLPNWLGDLVMSTAFVRALSESVPDGVIQVIVKKGIDQVVDYLPGVSRKWVFNKDEYPGLKGSWNFGKMIGNQFSPDLMFCLPDSFSSAVMTKATGAPVRIGYPKELRSFLLTKTIRKNNDLHRVDQYLQLLKPAGFNLPSKPAVFLENRSKRVDNRILINVNSEADARRLPVEKAISIIDLLRENTDAELVMVGSPKEVPHVNSVLDGLKSRENILNMSGKTNLSQLIDLFGTAPVMLTTDSGPMHLANALGVHTVALEGASDEKNTAPYNADRRTLIRSGLLPCEPCVKNVCIYGTPKCLMNMQDKLIVDAVTGALEKYKN
ncbi:MAG: glycosyltransferase family 9 protein [Chitinophagaceae bacterium]|nr:glycosyltransferase family 9 protein [Chitinophagaceae bacterium]